VIQNAGPIRGLDRFRSVKQLVVLLQITKAIMLKLLVQ